MPRSPRASSIIYQRLGYFTTNVNDVWQLGRVQVETALGRREGGHDGGVQRGVSMS